MATLGHYELVREIGDGGMATVYAAVDQRIGRRVALKVLTLPLYLSQGQRQVMIDRLMREARAAGRLSHPNIVTVYDVGQDGGHHFIAMEFLEGQPLRARLEEGPLPLPEAAHILEGVAAGLDHAHTAGVLHRDIKPSNVMLLPDGRVKLTDFGVARHTDDPQLTQTGVPVGSPAYMAPEQVRGEPVTPASDRWSLGVLLYEMLAGQPPFTGDNIPAILHQVAYHPAPRLPHASRAMQTVLDRALAREPNRRYASAAAMAAEFRKATGGAPVQARRESRALALPDAAVAGAKGGEVAARAHPSPRLGLWVWAIPLVALLALTPFLLLRSAQDREVSSRSPTARGPAVHAPKRPSAAGSHPAPVSKAASVEVTEIKAPPAPAAGPKPPARAARQRPRQSADHRSTVRRTPRPAVTPAAPPRVRRQRKAAPAAPRRGDDGVIRVALSSAPSTRRVRRAAAPPASPRSDRSTRMNARALDSRGYRLLRRGQAAAAEPLLREAVRRDPGYAYAQYNLGWSLLEQGKAREALAPLRRTAAQQRNRWEPHHRLAQAYSRLGEHQKAREAAARAEALRRGRNRRS